MALDEVKTLLGLLMRIEDLTAVDERPAAPLEAYLRTISLGVIPPKQSMGRQTVQCARGVAKALGRAQVVLLVSQMRPYLPPRAVQTATKADLCALVAEDIVDSITRILCTVNLLQCPLSMHRELARSAAALSGCAEDKLEGLPRPHLCALIASSLTSEYRAALLNLGNSADVASSLPWRLLGEEAAPLEGDDPHRDGLAHTLRLMSLLLPVSGERKARAVRSHARVAAKAALSPPRVWNAVLAMTGGGGDSPPPSSGRCGR
eukprot:jgi/Mesvir1/21825/Mv04210-RA.1